VLFSWRQIPSPDVDDFFMSIDREDRQIIGEAVGFCVVFLITMIWNWRTYSFLSNVAVSITETIVFLIGYAIVSTIFCLPNGE
jgi:hypothetical protein